MSRKPTVGILFSDSRRSSSESKNIATYMGACLVHGKYSSVRLVSLPLENNGDVRKDGVLGKVRVSLPGAGQEVTIAESEDFRRMEFVDVASCHLILICVNPEDTERCAKLLAEVLQQKKQHDDKMEKGIFTFQYGPKNYEKLEEKLKHIPSYTLVDGVMGFHVIKGVVDGVYREATAGGHLVIERLSKEKADSATKFVNLLSTMDIPILFRKGLTPYTWGGLVHDCYFASTALTGESLDIHIMSRTNRLIYAQMIRECLMAFDSASKNGSWKPDNGAASALPLKVLELLLCLPNVMFAPISRIFLRPARGERSPCQVDLHENRASLGLWSMRQLVGVGAKYQVDMPACTKVLELLYAAEKDGNGVPSMLPTDLYGKIRADFGSTSQLIQYALLASSLVLGLWLLFVVFDALVPRKI